jgi:hypothetical protein
MDTGTKRTPAKESLPPEVAKAIEFVFDYYWQEQLEAFIAEEPGPDDEHCFRALVAIDQWFYGHETSAEKFVADYEADVEERLERLRNTRDE